MVQAQDSLPTYEIAASGSDDRRLEVQPDQAESCPRTIQPVPELCGERMYENLARSLSGTCLNIPSLQAVLASWPSGVNVHLERLRPEVDKMLER
jgi:hypothetical protein